MSDLMKRLMALREKALEPQREPISTVTTMADAGNDAAPAPIQGPSAIEMGAKAWRSLFELRSIQP